MPPPQRGVGSMVLASTAILAAWLTAGFLARVAPYLISVVITFVVAGFILWHAWLVTASPGALAALSGRSVVF
jgi:hypothetical protein